MKIIISNSSDIPIYQQIVDNIRQGILTGELVGGEALPSIRTLAKDLRISNITTKRAYEELERDGFIEAMGTRGYFVKTKNEEFRKEEILTHIEKSLIDAIHMSHLYHVPKEELISMMEVLYEEENNE